MTKENCNATESIDQGNTSTQKFIEINEKVFVEGERRRDLEAIMYFPHNGKKIDCYTEFLDDQITLALDPIHEYVRQIDELTTKEGDCGQTLKDMIGIVYALESNARRILEEWQNDLEKHIGRPGIRRVCHGNNSHDLKPTVAVGVDFIQHNS